MAKSNQKGMLSAQLVLVILIAASVFGYTAWSIYKSKEDRKNTTSSPAVSLASDDVVVSGSVQLAKQGPADEIVGYEPATATLVVGSEASLAAWRDNPARKAGEYLLSELYKPSDIKVKETENGKFSVTLKRNKDVMCIANRMVFSLTNDAETNETKYSFFDCKKFITDSDTAQADITLIGFGSNSIKCNEDTCKKFPFRVD